MKKIFCLSLMALTFAACSHKGHDHEHEGHDHEAELIEGKEHNHEKEPDGVVVLHDEMASRFGVKVDSVSLAPVAESIRSSALIGRAAGSEGIVAAPAAGTVRLLAGLGQRVSAGAAIASVNTSAVAGGDRNKAARAALTAAQAEVDRLKPLFEERLVTAAEYQSAVAALELAKADYSPVASSGRAVAPVSGTIVELLAADGAYVEAGAPIAKVAADGRLTLTARTSSDNYARLHGVTDVRVQTSAGRPVLLSELGGKPGGVSAADGYATVMFSFNNDGTFAPGTTVEAWLLTNGTDEAVSLPLGAIVEQQGAHFVYREVMPEHYLKTPVTIGASDGERVRIISGVNHGDRIVTSGVITVRLAESSGAIPSGHNHSH